MNLYISTHVHGNVVFFSTVVKKYIFTKHQAVRLQAAGSQPVSTVGLASAISKSGKTGTAMTGESYPLCQLSHLVSRAADYWISGLPCDANCHQGDSWRYNDFSWCWGWCAGTCFCCVPQQLILGAQWHCARHFWPIRSLDFADFK